MSADQLTFNFVSELVFLRVEKISSHPHKTESWYLLGVLFFSFLLPVVSIWDSPRAFHKLIIIIVKRFM